MDRFDLSFLASYTYYPEPGIDVGWCFEDCLDQTMRMNVLLLGVSVRL